VAFALTVSENPFARPAKSRTLRFVKQLAWVGGAVLIVACGGRAHAPETEASGGGAGSAGASTASAGALDAAGTTSAGAPGVGPIDTTNLATEFPDPSCAGPLASLHLALPCKVGMRLAGAAEGGFAVVECYDMSGRTALNFSIELGGAARSIGRSLTLPFDSLDGTPLLRLPPIAIEVDGVQYTGILKGSLTFEQVDPAGRAFVAYLARGYVTWTDPTEKETNCELDPMRLWATAGDFI
jgi:hypothetical protein